MNRKRDSDETYEQYRRNLKQEARNLKNYLRGRLVWDATDFGQLTEDRKDRLFGERK
jgi:hypothetical protein